MRTMLLAVLILSSCSGPKEAGAPVGSYFGAGRDALCVAGEAGVQRAGLIAYGAGNANCSASGALVKEGQGFVLTPNGDSGCRIGLAAEGETLRVAAVSPGCAYYCGPGAAMAGRAFTLTHEQGSYAAPHDFGGDPLC